MTERGVRKKAPAVLTLLATSPESAAATSGHPLAPPSLVGGPPQETVQLGALAAQCGHVVATGRDPCDALRADLCHLLFLLPGMWA